MSDITHCVLNAGIAEASVSKVVEALKKLGVQEGNDLLYLTEEDYKYTG